MIPDFILGQSVRVISQIDINFPRELSYWFNSKGIVVDMYITGLFSNTWRYDLIHPDNGNICTFEISELDLRSKKKNHIEVNKLKEKEIDDLQNLLLKTISIYPLETQIYLIEWLDRNYWDFNVNSLNKYRETLDYNIENCPETKEFWSFLDTNINCTEKIKNIFIVTRKIITRKVLVKDE